MPNPDYALLMARYNIWQNESLIHAASELTVADRQADRGAFFGSIEQTFSHILWADRIWLSRFAGTEAPPEGAAPTVAQTGSWDHFKTERTKFDQDILKWARGLSPDWFNGDLTWYAGSVGRMMTNPKTVLIVHMFNHQTHHRGQIHAMLTAAKARPEATDLQHMPERYLQL